MHHRANPMLVDLYNRAVFCRTFPAYRIEELLDEPRPLQVWERLYVMQLLAIAQQVR